MPQKWYESRTNQAALIAGVFLVMATTIGALLSNQNSSVLPPLEIKAIQSGQATVLSTLALRPDRQLLDSGDFAALRSDYVLLSDTFGIAVEEPGDHRWTAGPLGAPGGVSLQDLPLIGAMVDETRKLWGSTLSGTFHTTVSS